MQGLADAHLAKRAVGVLNPLDKDFRPATGVLDRAQPGLDDPRVVDHEQIVRAQQADDLAELPVRDRVASQLQQPAVRSRRQRRAGDEVFRQVIGEV